ncbi:MAG TPA: polysaccharide biosynthesis/export family protein [Candidatus Nitrosotenuis sp.]|nr:polysaccharide biosynthesis/export family protein [Candidatus Nitrosotenuis sp.]
MLVALLHLAAPAWSQQAPATPPRGISSYSIGPEDLLVISVLEAPDLSREVRVAADGTVGLPLLAERVRLQGLTLSQAEELLVKKYKEAGILNQPNITITVKELVSKPVTVAGAVRNPGVFQVSGESTLLRLLTQAGGFSEDAGGVVQVLRANSAQPLSVSAEDLRSGKPEANMAVYGGDTINVPPAGSVYVVGAVNKPGRYLLRGDGSEMSVLRVVAMAEDLKRTSRPDKAVLIRRDLSACPGGVCGPDALKQIPVDIKKILARKTPDVAVLPNDVLFVPESAGKRAFTRGLEAAIQVASGILVFGVAR